MGDLRGLLARSVPLAFAFVGEALSTELDFEDFIFSDSLLIFCRLHLRIVAVRRGTFAFRLC